jgi:hypothetical protein
MLSRLWMQPVDRSQMVERACSRTPHWQRSPTGQDSKGPIPQPAVPGDCYSGKAHAGRAELEFLQAAKPRVVRSS